jgi:hypothetical protein
MALTDKEKTAYLFARLAAIEEFLSTAFPSFGGDYIEATARAIDADTAISGNGKKEAKDEMETKRKVKK